MTKTNKIALMVLAASLAACSDGLVAPQNEAPATPSVDLGGSMQALTGSDTVKFSITIDPSRVTTYSLGDGNTLVFPAHSLCEPTKSSYGVGEWDKPCVGATSSLTIAVKAWLDSYGHARIDFGTSVRFVPSTNSSQWVKLTFRDLQASLDPYYNILYCKNANSPCIDETKQDATLLTTRDPLTGKVSRRIKHFSGYNVAVGRGGDSENRTSSTSTLSHVVSLASSQLTLPSMRAMKDFFRMADVDVLLSHVEFFRHFSGYMLASG